MICLFLCRTFVAFVIHFIKSELHFSPIIIVF